MNPSIRSRSRQPRALGRRRGFTLIELLIAVAIVALLSSIAYPSYADHVRRSRIQEAFVAMADYRVKLEQYFQDHRNYGTTIGSDCANALPAPPWADFKPNGAKSFTFSCKVDSATGYTITATGIDATQARGHVYTVNETNAQTTSKFKGATVTKGCWLARGDEC